MQNVKFASQQCRGPRSGEWQSAWFRIAAGTLPNLDPDRAETLVLQATGSNCGAALTPADRDWLELYLAVARRDAASLATAADTLLTGAQELTDPEQRAYVVTAGMLGLLQLGRPEDALALWRTHGDTQFATSGIPEYTRLVLQLAGHAVT